MTTTTWPGWDTSNLPWSAAKHQDAVCAAVFGPAWSMGDAHAVISAVEAALSDTKAPVPSEAMIERIAIDLHNADADDHTAKWAKQPGKYRASIRRDVRDVLASLDRLGIFRPAALAVKPVHEPVACQYAQDVSMPEHHCAVRCAYEQKGFLTGIEQAAQIADRYDDTDTLTAPKAIAAEIRALGVQS